MTSNHLVPVMIGVGDIINRSIRPDDAIEPRKLMVDAISAALEDAQASSQNALLSKVDSIDIVATWTWPYHDLPSLIADDLRISPIYKQIPKTHGGNQPAKFIDEAAKRIAAGQANVAIVCGGEALASLNACAKAGKLPPPGWTKIEHNVKSVFSPTTRELETGLGAPHRIGAPIHVYPLYENAFRAHHGQSIADNHRQSAELYGDFAKVAQQNPLAWNYGKSAETAASIGTISERNRMICFPYPLLMNAFNTVNVAAACILTSTKHARDLKVPESRWIYPLGGAGTRDSYDFWERPNYHSSASISRSIDAALEVSGITKENVDLYDFYSCFPIVPKLACEHLGLSITNCEKPITLLGGLTSFGGAGNNYSMHAVTEMVRCLRNGEGNTGLILANGGVVTYQHVICLSSKPRSDGTGYPLRNVLPDVVTDLVAPTIETNPTGDAVIETYTVEFSRNGKPLRGFVIGRLQSDGSRFVANHGDESTLQQLSSFNNEPIGRSGTVRRDPNNKDRNLFSFANAAKL